MILDVTIKDESGETIGKLILNPKDFKTGSRGFYGSAKLVIGGKNYQTQCQLVEIGSKAAADETKKG
jgi:hypothetical protein